MNPVISADRRESLAYHRHPCKSLVKEKAQDLCSRSGERVVCLIGIGRCARMPLGVWFLRPCRTGHPFAASGPEEPSQKIELVFSASPETIRREPRESPPSPGR